MEKKQQAACNTYTITRQEKEKLRPNTFKRKRESAAAACLPSAPRRVRDSDSSLWGSREQRFSEPRCLPALVSVSSVLFTV